MTGAGSANIAYAEESTYNTEPGSPTYRHPGRDLRVEELELSNELQRISETGSVESVESLAQNLAGASAYSWVLSGNEYHNLVFNDDSDASGTNDQWTSGLAQSATWYHGLDYASSGSISTVERVVTGWSPTRWEITWEQGQPPRITLAGIYADEKYNTSVTPSSITRETNTQAHHSSNLTVDSTTQIREQSITLQAEPLALPMRGSTRHIDQVVMGDPEPTLTVEAIFSETDQLELSYGSSGSTSTQDTVGGVSATWTYSDSGGTVAEYNFSTLTPNTYTWNDLVSSDGNTTERVQFQANGLTATD